MRSVFIIYPKPREAMIRAWMDKHATAVDEDKWHLYSFISHQPELNIPGLYCSLCEDYSDWEPELVTTLRSRFPGRFAHVQANVSGSIDGTKEVRKLVVGLLTAVPGSVADDDYTTHQWTLEEVRDNVLVEGHSFFDYKGWHNAL